MVKLADTFEFAAGEVIETAGTLVLLMKVRLAAGAMAPESRE